jgi:site-specific recombinase XerC
MAADLIPLPRGGPALTSLPTDRLRAYLENARARNTITGYRSSFRQFTNWCEAAERIALPAVVETIALYISARAEDLRPSTLEHHLAAIGKAHKAAGFASPIKDNIVVAETLKGIKRTHGVAPKQKAPILTEDLRVMLRMLPRNLRGIRDRALLLVGFAGAFRRSELVALNVGDLKFKQQGLLLDLRRSKTDQEGEGRQVAIPYGLHQETCPVHALHGWLEAALISRRARVSTDSQRRHCASESFDGARGCGRGEDICTGSWLIR